MKKEKLGFKIFLSVMFLVLIVGSIGIVSAQNSVIDVAYEQVGSAFASIFAPIFDINEFDDFLFVKILLFIVIFAVSFMSLDRITIFEDNKPIRVIVGIIVAVLAVRYLKETDLTRAILLPYGALGGAITIMLPLLIYFFFVHTSIEGGFGRRIAWFFYGVIFLFLWGQQPYMGSANWVYISALIFVLVNLIFDKKIHRYFQMEKIEKVKKGVVDERKIDLVDKYNTALKNSMFREAKKIAKKLKKLGHSLNG